MTQTEIRERIIGLLKCIERIGMGNVITYLVTDGFFSFNDRVFG